MAQLRPRARSNGEYRWRIKIKHEGLPTLYLTFEDEELAQKWIKKHYESYVKDPSPYLEWIRIRRLWKLKVPIDTLDLTY